MKLSPEVAKERAKARDRAKKARKRSKVKRLENLPPGISKTDPGYRRRMFGIAPEKTKPELRAIIAAAVRNTAGLSR